jgi:hypothetical protein
MERKRDLSWLKDWRALILYGGCIFAGFLMGMLIFGSPWHLPPAWGDIPTWVTAIATVGLLTGAIVTAIYAIKAFREQSREVAAIEQQVKDEQKVTRQQAELLKIQTGQLEVLRAQLAEDRKINQLQAEDLRESLTERRRLRQAAERQQADEIGFRLTTTSFPHNLEEGDDFAVDPGESVHMAVVSNESRRPIKNVKCRIGGTSDIDDLLKTRESDFAVVVGRVLPVSDHPGLDVRSPSGLPDDPDAPIHPVAASSRSRIPPGEQYGFVFEIDSHRALGLVSDIAVRFTDDAGLHWQIDPDQHLKQLPKRDW